MQVESGRDEAEGLPFVAPCRTLTPLAPLRWLKLGFRDFRRAWPQSLAYGMFMAAGIATVSWLAWRYGSYWFMFAMLGGFVFLAPLSCTGLYVLSAQLERGQPPSLGRARAAAFKQYLGNELVFALVLLIVFLVWARAAAMVSVFLPMRANPPLRELVTYLSIGTVVGAVFAGVTFSVSAFSLPMIVHRRVDAVTAVVTSVNAVLRNKLTMLIWLGLAVASLVLGGGDGVHRARGAAAGHRSCRMARLSRGDRRERFSAPPERRDRVPAPCDGRSSIGCNVRPHSLCRPAACGSERNWPIIALRIQVGP